METIRVFEMGRSEGELDVALPAGWARELASVQIVFSEAGRLGWHAHVASPEGEHVLGFPWSDHVDQMLRGEIRNELPDRLGDAGWDELDQGWWGVITPHGERVFIAETDFDAMLAVPGSPELTLVEPGVVSVSGVRVAWTSVPRTAWDAAWEAARATARRGLHGATIRCDGEHAP